MIATEQLANHPVVDKQRNLLSSELFQASSSTPVTTNFFSPTLSKPGSVWTTQKPLDLIAYRHYLPCESALTFLVILFPHESP